uniref:IF rod domain-containing protein n=2 Tax=Macrostomum lignano TaxID=282301 RepID=A0A1I8GHL2_9PLAT
NSIVESLARSLQQDWPGAGDLGGGGGRRRSVSQGPQHRRFTGAAAAAAAEEEALSRYMGFREREEILKNEINRLESYLSNLQRNLIRSGAALQLACRAGKFRASKMDASNDSGKKQQHQSRLDEALAAGYSAIAEPRRTDISVSAGDQRRRSSRRSRRRQSAGAASSSSTSGIPDIRSTVETRSRSKREMQELNERLAGFIEKSRYLQAQNKRLKEELDQLRSIWGRETEKVRRSLEAELAQMRRLLDSAEAAKGEREARVATLEGQLREIREHLSSVTQSHGQLTDRLDRANHELADRDGEISLLRRRQGQLEDEVSRVRQRLERSRADGDRLRADLEAETAGRVAGQTAGQSVREELQLVRLVHEQELEELRGLVKTSTDRDDSRAFWKSELSQAIHEIQREYDDKLDGVREELEGVYVDKLRDFVKAHTEAQNGGTGALNQLKEENQRLKDGNSELRDRVSDLQTRCEVLQRQAEEYRNEAEAAQRRNDAERDRLDQQRRVAEEDLRRVLQELQGLTDAKVSLELEIAAYRKLLDAEGEALDAAALAAPEMRANQQRDRIHAVQQQQALEAPTGDRNSLQPPVKAITTEVTAKTQFEKTFKGGICIDECSPEGTYIQLRNVGSKKETLIGWRLTRTIDSRSQPKEFPLPNLVLDPGDVCRLWAEDEKPSDASEVDAEVSVRRWEVGNYSRTVLYNADGQERARHVQKTFMTSPV